MKLGYNTNGFAHHRLTDAIAILAEQGYQSVAITLDYHSLPPFAADSGPQVEEVRNLLRDYRLSCVIETGARFLLDPYRKHQPTLLDPDSNERARRIGLLMRAINYAQVLGADAVSFWSGAVPTPTSAGGAGEVSQSSKCWQRLIDACRWLSDQASQRGVRLAFEPEPRMLVSTMDDYARLHEAVNHPAFGLTLDVGHLHCLGEGPIPQIIVDWRQVLWNIHIEDMRHGVHEHLMFGEGEMEFEEIARALHTIDYQGGVHVELSRHSHDAVNTAALAREFLLAHGFLLAKSALMKESTSR
jgi:sugar phosphate isomerase/epimerase